MQSGNISYDKGGASLKQLPKQGENINVFLRPGDEFHAPIDFSTAQFQVVNTDVIVTLPNGGKVTFVSLGLMAFDSNPPLVKFANNSTFDVAQILDKVHDISQTSKDSILASGDITIPTEQKDSQSKKALLMMKSQKIIMPIM